MKRTVFIAGMILWCGTTQANWTIKYDLGNYLVSSDEVEVRSLRDSVVKTHVQIIYSCTVKEQEEGISLVFKNTPQFSNTDIVDLGKARKFGLMVALIKWGPENEEPKMDYVQVLQAKHIPEVVVFDSGLINKMRKFDQMNIGFGWGSAPNVKGVVAKAALVGSQPLINEARKRCGLPHLPDGS